MCQKCFLFKILTALKPKLMAQPMYPKMLRGNGRIVNGQFAKKGQFPFQVELRMIKHLSQQ
jgi:hypothetical protein